MNTTFIYVLKDPDTGKIRYVGKSGEPSKRLEKHLKEKIPNHRVSWIRTLKQKGKTPVLEVLDEVSESEWQFWEREYIRVFKLIGMDLVNSTIGGDGVMSGRTASVESREKQSKAMTGRKYTKEHVQKSADARRGAIRSLEAVRKNQAGHFGKITSRNTSGFVGVTWDKQTRKWLAALMWNGQTFTLGRFENIQDAVNARKTAENERKCRGRNF